MKENFDGSRITPINLSTKYLFIFFNGLPFSNLLLSVLSSQSFELGVLFSDVGQNFYKIFVSGKIDIF